jgi:predicted dehydrogenase
MGGGVLHWLGIHDIDVLLWLTGERIVEAQAMTATVGNPNIAVEDVAAAAIRFESGAIGTLHAAYALPAEPSEGRLALRGTRGAVTIALDGGWRWTGDGPPAPARGSTPDAAPPGYTGGVLMLDDLFRAIMGDREPAATIADAAEALRVVDAIYASSASGRREPVAHPPDG